MNAEPKTTKFGDWIVPVLRRDWVSAEQQPYRMTYQLTPGQLWGDAQTTEKQSESYALLPDGVAVPVGALIARELIASGASSAVFTELWAGKCICVGPDLICVPGEGPVHELLCELRAANNGLYGGLPDVIGLYRDGRVAMREAKNLAKKDRLGPKQHRFASAAQRLLGARLDLAVIEWGLIK